MVVSAFEPGAEGPMKPTTIRRLEKQLRLKLPATYLAIVERCEKERDKALAEPWESTSLIATTLLQLDAQRLLWMNRRARTNPKHLCRQPVELRDEWPEYLFVCGYANCGEVYYLLDSRQKNPPLLEINCYETPRLARSGEYPTLAALVKEVQRRYRELGSLRRDMRQHPEVAASFKRNQDKLRQDTAMRKQAEAQWWANQPKPKPAGCAPKKR